MRRTKGYKLVEFVLMQLQVLETRPADDSSKRMAYKIDLKVLQLQRINIILDLNGQPMRGLLNLLLSLALIHRRQQTEHIAILIPQIIANRFHIVRRSLVAMDQHYQLYLFALL